MYDKIQELLADLKKETEAAVTNPRTKAMLTRYLEDFDDKYSGAAVRGELYLSQRA